MNSIEEAIKQYVDKLTNKEEFLDGNKVKVSALAAGVCISLGAFVSVCVGTSLPIGLSKLLSGMIFSSALIMIVLLGLDLFTGNVLASFKYIKKFSLESFYKFWSITYIWNLVGCILTTAAIQLSGLAQPLQQKFTEIALMKCSLPFMQAFTRGILCNVLVCIAVLLATEAKSLQGKIFGIMIPITVFIASGYEHSIANMFFIPMGQVTIAQFLHNLIPVTLGNIVGGILVVLVLTYIKEVKDV